MHALFLPGIGASHREFPEYELIFDEFTIIRYNGCITLDDHLNRIDSYVNELEQNNTAYVMIGHSLGAHLTYHYVTHRELQMLQSYTLIGGAPRFEPLNSWNTIFSLPKWGIAFVLFFIALGTPFLFLVYGWHGMFQRINVIDMFQREGIENIRDVYNHTLVPLIQDPLPDTSAIPSQIIRLPNDLLFPQSAMNETRELISSIQETLIQRDLIHFSHHLDVLVVGHIHNFLVDNEIGNQAERTLSYDISYALANPHSVSVEVEGFAVPRLPVVLLLLILVLNGIRVTYPTWRISILMTDFIQNFFQSLNIDGVSGIVIISVIFLLLLSLYGYYWLVNPRFPEEKQTHLGKYPKVSIIVPMRNEERNIATCLKSLLSLSYPDFEIVISDGQSSDRSREIAQETVDTYNSMNIPVQILQEGDLPDGWIGKSWGCWNAVKKTSGEYLLFTDADTIHDPSSLRKVMRLIQQQNFDGLSIIGKFQTLSFWERAILPFFKSLLFIIFGGRYSSKRRVLAIGQYIVVKSDLYHEFSGHEAIRSEIAEDIHLGQKIASMGHFKSYNGNHIYEVRMYQSLLEIKEGLERNATESVGNSSMMAVFASIGLISWRILPLLVYPLVYHLLSPLSSFLFLAYTAFTIFLFVVDTKINDVPWYCAFLFPLGLLLLVSFLINASVKKVDHQPRMWKGRLYSS